jgi:demethylmenaquinone methyltransferase/2-methoxy-6-polyprenyl-1,4-benzoquinol methylase
VKALVVDNKAQQNPGTAKGTVGARTDEHQDQQAAATAVREMFSSIAPHYDLLNHVLSMNIDRLWWWRTARRFRHVLSNPNAKVLDLCCGTGDMAFALYRQTKGSGAEITGVDFSAAMLARAKAKTGDKPMRWIEADALNLPLADSEFSLVTAAFGFRNLANYDAGLREIARVLKTGGEVGILDFGEPKGFIGKLYRFYFKRVLPAIGTVISGVKGPYAYLPKSVERFPEPDEMLQGMRAAGFSQVSYTPYTFGIAGLYWGRK